jgi:hypothetical protein
MGLIGKKFAKNEIDLKSDGKKIITFGAKSNFFQI